CARGYYGSRRLYYFDYW
nr:immunoglobulin heavy chain junction region [Mus musculus]MBK4188181.1 immunoglobulin heavy chain junction region [Mus musculus]